jgi:hypothetical protein
MGRWQLGGVYYQSCRVGTSEHPSVHPIRRSLPAPVRESQLHECHCLSRVAAPPLWGVDKWHNL